jgi:hypothetical protein
MPTDTFLTRLNAPHRAAIGTTPGKLRLLFIADRAGSETPPLSSHDLSDIRIFTGARVVYALTDARVAGAVAQSSMYDYRREGAAKNKHSHFGVPLSCVEVKLVDTDVHKTTDQSARGEVGLLFFHHKTLEMLTFAQIVVTGSSVSGGEVKLGVAGTFRDDCTLAYI